jgi:hypothetical protein
MGPMRGDTSMLATIITLLFVVRPCIKTQPQKWCYWLQNGISEVAFWGFFANCFIFCASLFSVFCAYYLVVFKCSTV